MIQLRIFGALDLRGPEGRELSAVLSQPKRLALLACLAVTSAHGFQRRDTILALFWPELDNEHARAALNRALYYLRRSLGEGVLLSRGDEEIGLSAHIWCDVAAFQAAVTQARYKDAVELYRGDLLEGFFISDSPAFERWLDTERERLRELAYRAAWMFAEEQSTAGNYASAGFWARWAGERSPYDEAGVRRLISFLDAMGDRAGAVYAYEQFARRIADDLELTPAPETQALIESVRARTLPAVSNGVPISNGVHQSTAQQPVADAVVANEPAAELRVVRRGPDWSRAKTLAAGVAAAFALIATALVVTATRRSTLNARQVVVAHFENRTGDPSFDRLGHVTAQWIRQSLTETGLVETVDVPVTGGDHQGQSCENIRDLRELAKQANAGTVVCGAMYREAGTIRFHTGVLDVLRAAPVWTIPSISAPVDSPDPAIREVRQRATGAVAALVNPGFASWFRHATAPPTIEAFQEYLIRPQESRAEMAARWQRAYALDTTFTWAAMQAAAILVAVDPAKADSLLHWLDARRNRLPALQVAWLTWIIATAADDPGAAYQAMTSAVQLAPSFFLSNLMQTTRDLYRPGECLELLNQLEALSARGNKKNQPWTFVRRTEYLHQLGEYRRELRVARRTRRDQPNSLATLYAEVRARAALGQLRSVRALIDAALSLPREPMYTPGGVMIVAATEFRAHGHRTAEAELLDRAIAWYRANRTAEPDSSMGSLAFLLYQAGQWDEAEPLFQQLLVKDPVQIAYYQASLGAIAARRGDRAGAQRFLDDLNALTYQNGLRAYDGKLQRARLMAVLGDAEGAIQLLREAAGPQGTDLHAEFDFESLADYPEFREFMRPKG